VHQHVVPTDITLCGHSIVPLLMAGILPFGDFA
jgi:hypothetical protein